MGILAEIKARSRAHFVKIGAVALGATALTITPAAAQDLSPITTMLTTIGTALTGPLGRAFGLVALAGVGFAFMTGRMNWPLAGSIVIGLAILFGAAAILAGF
ncbi:MAG: TrbC/VirB2 family protein [Pseudomonadota bacterium]